MHVLLVDGNLEMGTVLQRSLSKQGFTSEWVRSALHATALAVSSDGTGDAPFVCTVLNLHLPDAGGIELIRRWRARGVDLPVVMHSANDDVASRIAALDAGADDFHMGDPSSGELASRLRAVVRRSSGHSSARWRAGELEIDTGMHEVRLRGCTLALSRTEFALLLELVRQRGRVVTRRVLIRAASPLSEPMAPAAVEWHIHRLRTKLGASAIRTVRGVGYGLIATGACTKGEGACTS